MDKKNLTPADMKQREKYIKGMKKSNGGEFEKRYPGRGKEVMYATANKMAMKESYKDYFKQRLFENLLNEAEYQGSEDGVPTFIPSPSPTSNPQIPGGGSVTIRPRNPPSKPLPALPTTSEEDQAPKRDRRQRNRTPSSYQD